MAQVDVDLSPEQFAAKVSRQQARLFLKADGAFRLANTGRRKFLVNNCQARPWLPVRYGLNFPAHCLDSRDEHRRRKDPSTCNPPIGLAAVRS